MKLLLDTQLFIFAHKQFAQAEQLLTFISHNREQFRLVFSAETLYELQRVSRRVGGKDWEGALLDNLWKMFDIEVVLLPPHARETVLQAQSFVIPAEDWDVFLTAWFGEIDVMISENHEFVRRAAESQQRFTCLNTAEFMARYS